MNTQEELSSEVQRKAEKPERGQEDIGKKQLDILKRQLWYSRISAIAIVILVLVLSISVVTIVPKLNQVLVELEQITADLSDEDIQKMVKNINDLTEASQKGVQQATDKLNKIDLESLNEAIDDLNSVVSPLARLFGKK